MVGMTPRHGRLRPPRHRPLRSWLALRGLVLLAACLALTGCRPVDLPSSTTASIRVGGVTRTYRLFVPTGLTGPAPLVVVLHGGYGSGAQAETAYHWDDRATAGGFVVAFPDGLHRSWNAGGGCCGQAGRDGVDDVAFLTALVAEVGRRASVDPRRVYATGMSNGGIMTYRLACETDLFAAVAPVAATGWWAVRPPHGCRCWRSTAPRTRSCRTRVDPAGRTARQEPMSTGHRCPTWWQGGGRSTGARRRASPAPAR